MLTLRLGLTKSVMPVLWLFSNRILTDSRTGQGVASNLAQRVDEALPLVPTTAVFTAPPRSFASYVLIYLFVLDE